MYLLDNPVLQRELLVNLRMHRAFVLLLVYLGLLGAVVWLQWPDQRQVDMSSSSEAKDLVNFFFVSQYLLASMMAPSFAAGAITGEKERKTYESLLASPLRPAAIILGKLLASLCHLGILIICSLPIVMLCVPLGGVSLYEVLAAYLALLVSVLCFGMISIACSTYFQRTVAALTVSYLIILPLSLWGAFLWWSLTSVGAVRLLLSLTLFPAISAVLCTILFITTTRRLMYPPDVGSEGKEVVDLEQEMERAVGMVIQSDQFPDKLFAPAKRNDLIPDGANPVYDKEMRSELFSQGTLMLRIVIQVSMFLAIPLMACFFYIWPAMAPWYIGYVLLFNMLIGPVFSADRVTSERERETLDLVLTTTVSPWQILWGKLLSGLRVSTVLTMFLVWPVALAALMVPQYWPNLLTMLAYVLIITLACVTTSTVALFCSVLFRKTSISLMCAYLIILAMFTLPPAVKFLVDAVAARKDALAESVVTGEAPADSATGGQASRARRIAAAVYVGSFTSPFSAAHSLPLKIEQPDDDVHRTDVSGEGGWQLFTLHTIFTVLLNTVLLGAVTWFFNVRWRVAN